MKSLEFLLKLKDQLSGPATGMARSLKGLRQQMVNTENQLLGYDPSKVFVDSMGRLQVKNVGFVKDIGRVRRSLLQLRAAFSVVGGAAMGGLWRGMTRLFPGLDRLSSSRPVQAMRSLAGAMGGKLAGAFSRVKGLAAGLLSHLQMLAPVALTAVGALGALAIGATAAFAKAVASAQKIRTDALFAFKFMLGSTAKAEGMLSELDTMARKLGISTATAWESVRELMSGGFSKNQAKDITKGLADLKALNPKANIETISAQMTQMLGAGTVKMEDLKPILDGGLDDSTFYKHLRRVTNIDNQSELKKAMGSGKVSAEKGLAAIMAAIKEMGGNKGLGAVAAEKAATTLEGSFNRVRDNWQRMKMAISTGGLGRQLKALADGVAKFLDPQSSSGVQLLFTLNRVAVMASWVFRFFSKPLGGGVFDMLLDGATSVLAVIYHLGVGIGAGLTGAFGALKAVFGGLLPDLQLGANGWKNLGKILRGAGEIFAYVAVGIVAVVAVLAVLSAAMIAIPAIVAIAVVGGLFWLVGKLAKFARYVSDQASALYEKGRYVGNMIADGIRDGLDGNWQGAVDRLRTLSDMLPATVKRILGIHSPSTVFAGLGEHTAAGMAQGLDRGQPGVQKSMEALVAAPAGPNVPAPQLVGRAASADAGASGAGPTGAPLAGATITVNVAAGGSEDIGEAVRRALLEALEDLSPQPLGAPA